MSQSEAFSLVLKDNFEGRTQGNTLIQRFYLVRKKATENNTYKPICHLEHFSFEELPYTHQAYRTAGWIALFFTRLGN